MANKGPKRSSPKTPKRRNGDSSLGTTDEHERNKDFLSEQEVETLRKEARAGRYGELTPMSETSSRFLPPVDRSGYPR
jgi:hypothetical protein